MVVCRLSRRIGGVDYAEATRQIARAYNYLLYLPKLINCFVAALR